jgi:hypothetical protein
MYLLICDQKIQKPSYTDKAFGRFNVYLNQDYFEIIHKLSLLIGSVSNISKKQDCICEQEGHDGPEITQLNIKTLHDKDMRSIYKSKYKI